MYLQTYKKNYQRKFTKKRTFSIASLDFVEIYYKEPEHDFKSDKK